MKKNLIITILLVYASMAFSQNDYATVSVCVTMPTSGGYVGSALKGHPFYIEIDDQFVGTADFGQCCEVHLAPGSYRVTIWPSIGAGGFAYYSDLEEIKSHLSKNKSKYEHILNLEKSDFVYLRMNPSSIRFAVEGKSEYNTHLAKGRITDSYIATYGIEPSENDTNQELAEYNSDKNQSETKIVSDIDADIPLCKSLNENTYVLIIANEKYEYLDDVTYAARDGKLFYEYCTKTLGIASKQIKLCEDASKGILQDGIYWLKYVLNNFEGSKAIVYYSGHGILDEKTDEAYLIPVDGKGTNMVTCYSLEKMYKELANTQAKSITYFLDACFTGASKDGNMLVAARGTAREPEKIKLSGKTIVFSASSGDETAMTLESQGHGLFTYYLLKKLQETKGNTTYGELSDYIKKNVQKDAFLINEKPQTPVVATSPEIADTWKNITLK